MSLECAYLPRIVLQCSPTIYPHVSTYIQFPNCVDTNAISVACLDLHYSVTIDRKAQRKAEKKETRVQPVALSELQDNEDLCENIDDGGTVLSLNPFMHI